MEFPKSPKQGKAYTQPKPKLRQPKQKMTYTKRLMAKMRKQINGRGSGNR